VKSVNPKIAVAQLNCRLGAVQVNLRRIEDRARSAWKREVDVLCFPELATTGYSLREKWVDLAEPIPGPTTERLGRMAREFGLYLIAGLSERASNRIFNSAVLMSRQGDLAGVYRKVHLWDAERRYFTAGRRFPIFRTEIGAVGIGICYDLEFPESARIMAISGAQIIFFPSAEMRPFEKKVDIYVQSRAAENRVFVCLSNRVGREGQTVFFGHSQIVSPAPHILAQARTSEKLAVARINLADISKEKERLPYLEQRVPTAYGRLGFGA
jgi:predicted amidohydrolase